jgi:ankyrin repeat protein
MSAMRGPQQIYTGNTTRDHATAVYGNVIHNYPPCHHSISSVGLDARGDSDTPNEQGQTYLGAAIMRRDHRTVAKLLEQDANANRNGMRNKTCLRLAIEVEDIVILQALINAGALLESTSGDLFAAASLGNSDIVRVLLGHATYAGKWQPECKSALLDACRRGRVDIALLFFAKIDYFQNSSHNGDSAYLGNDTDFECIRADALRIASGEGHDELVQIMLGRGFRVDICRGHEKTALQKASSKGHLTTVQILLREGANVSGTAGRYHDDALQLASSQGRADVVAELLSHGANANAGGGYYGNALQAASSNGHNRVVQLLVDRGHAEVNARGGYHADALQAASSNGHHEVVHTLLSHGAKVNAQGGHYGNALQAASVDGHAEVVHELLAGGASVNAEGGNYGTALQAAASHGHHRIVKILIEWGADVDIQGGEHGDALTAAYDSGCKETVLALGGEDLEGMDEALCLFLPSSSALLTLINTTSLKTRNPESVLDPIVFLMRSVVKVVRTPYFGVLPEVA